MGRNTFAKPAGGLASFTPNSATPYTQTPYRPQLASAMSTPFASGTAYPPRNFVSHSSVARITSFGTAPTQPSIAQHGGTAYPAGSAGMATAHNRYDGLICFTDRNHPSPSGHCPVARAAVIVMVSDTMCETVHRSRDPCRCRHTNARLPSRTDCWIPMMIRTCRRCVYFFFIRVRVFPIKRSDACNELMAISKNMRAQASQRSATVRRWV